MANNQKFCPQCGSAIEPQRQATTFDYVIGCYTGICGGLLGFFSGGGPIVPLLER